MAVATFLRQPRAGRASARGQPAQVRLLLVDTPSVREFVFPMNPAKMDTSLRADYADVPIALADAGSQDPAVQIEWKRNVPGEIAVEFKLHDMERGVDDDIMRLRGFLLRDPRTGEPPDLLFQRGETADVVRIRELRIHPTLWGEDLTPLAADVHLTLIVKRHVF